MFILKKFKFIKMKVKMKKTSRNKVEFDFLKYILVLRMLNNALVESKTYCY